MSSKSKFMNAVASTGCVICREKNGYIVNGTVHHIADGSNPRSDYMTACLCYEHHTGRNGLHTVGVKAFCREHRLPNEYYLIDLQHKFMIQDGVIHG